jgi:dTDP-4-amino-4,6-dideoxygalactose transaminase
MIKDKIWLSSPHLSGKESVYVQDALDSNWVAPLGPYVNQMEVALATQTNTKAAALLSSGTAAIHLALRLLKVQQGDVVICQSFTFSGSANPILYEKAQPIFIDSEADTWNMCPIALEQAILSAIKENNKPKAIIVVHLYGMPAKMDEILALATQYQIPVIEDAAEAIGSAYKGKACGGLSDFGILSFNGNKLITTSGGGALLSNNEAYIAKARFLASQAKDSSPHYEHTELGFNYRLSNVSAAIGVAQLEVLEERVAARRHNFDYYKNALQHIEELTFLEEPEGCFSNRWLSCILVNDKNNKIDPTKIRLALEAENIESRPLWKPMHLQPIFKGSMYFGHKVSENLFLKGLCLPSGSNLSQEDLNRVVLKIKSCL